MNQFLQISTNVKRFYKQAHPVIRQLELTGVLFIKGKHIFPNQWPNPRQKSTTTSPQYKSLVGRQFSRLTVINETNGKCECLCSCGKTTLVRRKHLLAERSKSCGCLRAEKAEINDERRFRRYQ